MQKILMDLNSSINIIEKMNIADLNTWTRKYNKLASEVINLGGLEFIIGINDIKLISIPIHIIIQLLVEIDIIDLIINVNKNMGVNIFLKN